MSSPLPAEVNKLLRHTQYRSAFEQLITSLSTRFINLPIESIDDGIVEALGKVGNYTGVDRCFVYQFADVQQTVARLSHEWTATGVPSIKHQLQEIPLQPLSWVVDRLTSGNIVHVADIRELPDEARPLRELYEMLDVRSAIYVPLFFKRETAGMLGLSCVGHRKEWSEDSIDLLRVVGEIVVNAVDRKNDYLQLQVSRERYKSVVEDQTDFIVRWKPDGTQTFVNGAICRFFDQSSTKLLTTNFFDSIHPTDVHHVRQKLANLTPAHPHSRDERRLANADGNYAWHEWSDRALFDECGQIIEYQSVGRDITSQKEAREELKYRQELETLILNLTSRFINLPPGQVTRKITDALRQVGEFVGGERSYIYLFDEARQSAELTFEWIAPFSPITPPELRFIANLTQDWGMQLLAQGESVRVSDLDSLPPSAVRLRDTLASIEVASLILVPLFLQEQLIGFMGISSRLRGQKWSNESSALLRLIGGVFANALERRNAEQALAASQERLSLTVEAVADGFYDWTVPTGCVNVSDNWPASRRGSEGCNRWSFDQWQQAIHTDDRYEVNRSISEHLSGASSVYQCEYRLLTPDGSWCWILDRGRVIERNAKGAALRMVGVVRDISEEVQRRRRLLEAEDRLAHLARVATMGEIVAGIAHEVNQPLHAAATFATAVSTALDSAEPGFEERARHMVGRISTQIQRAADIIRRLREFTRPSRMHMTRFDLNTLIRETADMLAYEAKRKRIRLEFDVDEFLPAVVGDRIQIQQVVVNLLRNAFDAIDVDSDRAPLIAVQTRRTQDGILLSITDNGVGLAADKTVEELFDAFNTTKPEGMGIGLALSRTIITSHHGRIWGESNEEAGMTFFVLLPVELGKNDE